jgi:rubredoxin-NAD+ reductase
MTNDKSSKVVIIGSGMAGYMMAQRLREESADIKITLITETDGRFYPKPMLSTALYHQKKPNEIVTATAHEMQEKYQLEVVTYARVLNVDGKHKEIELEDRSVHYDKLVLAVGSNVRSVFPKMERLYSVNSIEDYEKLLETLSPKRRVLVIGSGLVGVEFAHDLVHVGHDVSMLSLEDAALYPLVPREVGRKCRDHLIQKGLKWVQGAVKKIQEHDECITVDWGHGGESFDLVLSAVGIEPRTDLAQRMGLSIGRGILTDHYGRTSDPHVFAMGDCAEIYGLNLTYVAPIKQQAQAIAKSLLGMYTAVTYPAMPVVVKIPTFPFTMVPVREVSPDGSWKIVQDDEEGFVAVFEDKESVLKGFVLAGGATKQRQAWLHKMPESIVKKAPDRQKHQ